MPQMSFKTNIMYSFKVIYELIFKNQKKAKRKLKGEQKTGRKQRVNTIISIITLTKWSNHRSLKENIVRLD